MGVSSVVSAVILSGAMVFGQTQSKVEYPKEINEGVYNVIPAYVHEVNWADNSDKLHTMHVQNNDNPNGYRITAYGSNMNNAAEDNFDNTAITNNTVGSNNRNMTDYYYIADDNKFTRSISNNEMQELDKMYSELGYSKYTIQFPVSKSEPFNQSKQEFLSTFPFDKLDDVAIYGYASPDGKKPEMQELLSKHRMDKVLDYILTNSSQTNTDVHTFFVCDESIPRNTCWKADIYYKTKE